MCTSVVWKKMVRGGIACDNGRNHHSQDASPMWTIKQVTLGKKKEAQKHKTSEKPNLDSKETWENTQEMKRRKQMCWEMTKQIWRQNAT